MLRKTKWWYRPCNRCGKMIRSSNRKTGSNLTYLYLNKTFKRCSRKRICNSCKIKVTCKQIIDKGYTKIILYPSSDKRAIAILTKPEYAISHKSFEKQYGKVITNTYLKQINKIKNKLVKRNFKRTSMVTNIVIDKDLKKKNPKEWARQYAKEYRRRYKEKCKKYYENYYKLNKEKEIKRVNDAGRRRKQISIHAKV